MSPRLLFEQELQNLKEDVSSMGERTIQVYAKLFQALIDEDEETMKGIVKNDRAINDMQRNIEAQCLTLLTRQQPVAGDLRLVSAALKVVTDIERIGDHVSDMAELFLRMHMPDLAVYSDKLPEMIIAAQKMICESIDAFVEHNPKAAAEVIAYDDVVDDYFNRVKEDLITDLRGGGKNVDDCIDVLMIAKYLEKIGDHAVNIGEWEIFQETGDLNHKRLL